MRARCHGSAVVLVVTLAAACGRPPPAGPAYRLVDHEPGSSAHVVTLDQTWRRVLDPGQAEQAFALRDVPPRRRLLFSIGMLPREQPVVLRFEVGLRSLSGAVERLYRRDVVRSGWIDAVLDLPAADLRDRTLVFSKAVIVGRAPDLAAGVWGDPVLLAPDGPSPRSLILVSIDTLRADCVAPYGGAHATPTPALAALARGGILYEQAYAPSTWTLPSHLSLLSGLPPIAVDAAVAAGHLEMLARALRKAGYLTAAFTGGGWLSPFFGFAEGFDTYFAFQAAPRGPGDLGCRAERLDGPAVLGRARAWLRRQGRAPTFLFLHTYDVHDRCPFATPSAPLGPGPDADRNERRRVLAYYRARIRQLDRRLGAFLAEVERLGLLETTLVVVTSDHGEALWEHGLYGHGPGMKPYAEIAHVPLILHDPGGGRAGTRVSEPVSLADVVPTILARLGVPVAASMSGRILPGGGGNAPATSSPIYDQSDDVLAVRVGSRKLVTSRTGAFPDEIYDLAADPGERHDRAEDGAESTTRLRALAAAYWQQGQQGSVPAGSRPAPALDPATRQRLRELGYVE